MITERTGKVKPVAGEPALLLGDALVVADIHLGIEAEAGSEQVAEKAIRRTVDRMATLMEKTGAGRLIVLGDAGHILPEHKVSSAIARAVHVKVNAAALELARRFAAVFLSGNHDGSLAVRTEKELIIDSIGLFHGHRWPSDELMTCGTIIAAHSHPVVVFEDKLGCRTRQKVWVSGRATNRLLQRYGNGYGKANGRGDKGEGDRGDGDGEGEEGGGEGKRIEMVIMPAFTDFTAGWDIRRSFQGHGPAFEKDMFKIETAYLLDGTEITI